MRNTFYSKKFTWSTLDIIGNICHTCQALTKSRICQLTWHTQALLAVHLPILFTNTWRFAPENETTGNQPAKGSRKLAPLIVSWCICCHQEDNKITLIEITRVRSVSHWCSIRYKMNTKIWNRTIYQWITFSWTIIGGESHFVFTSDFTLKTYWCWPSLANGSHGNMMLISCYRPVDYALEIDEICAPVGHS